VPTYETLFITPPNLSEDDEQAVLDAMAQVVTTGGGAMLAKDRMGRRRLAYPIRKFEDGIYIRFLYDSEPDVPKELERRIRLSDNVLRSLTVVLERDWAAAAKVQAKRDAERRAEAAAEVERQAEAEAEKAAEADKASEAAAASSADETVEPAKADTDEEAGTATETASASTADETVEPAKADTDEEADTATEPAAEASAETEIVEDSPKKTE
jgi:small subunit ribosomal protein S6